MDVVTYLALLAPMVAIVWVAAETIGAAWCWNKLRVALVLGPVCSLMLWGVGLLPMLPTVFDGGEGLPMGSTVRFVVNAAWAMLSGLLATAGSTLLQDYVMKPRGIEAPPGPPPP